jgi:hypothetical protein
VITDSVSDGRLVSVWGPGTEFGSLRVSDSEIYWYGYFRCPEAAAFTDAVAAARSRVAAWAPWIRDLVAATPADRLMRHDVYHLPQGRPHTCVGGWCWPETPHTPASRPRVKELPPPWRTACAWDASSPYPFGQVVTSPRR